MAENVKEEVKKKKKSSGTKVKTHPKPDLEETEIKNIPEEKEEQVKLEDEPKGVEMIESQELRDAIKELYSDTMPKKIHYDEPYEVPKEVQPHDINALKDIDDRKLIELKECFKIFDVDGDGFINANDLRGLFRSLGEDVPEDQIQQMMSEALNPLDFDAFVVLMGYRTVDLDPEDVLLEAMSKWDKDGNGLINEELLRHDLMSFGDKFTAKECNYALEDAPIAKGTGEGFACKGPCMIEYPAFCKSLCGLRKRVKK